MLNEKIIETITIEGVDFQIIEKARTIYAGAYDVAPDLDSELDLKNCMKDEESFRLIKDSITPDCLLVLSIDYALDREIAQRPYAVLRGQETTSSEQPDGIYVLEAEPTMLIKVKSTDAAWALIKKLKGVDNPLCHMASLFTLIRCIFEGEKYNYEFNGCRQKGNEETEYYYFNGDKYVTVPVRIKV